MKPEPEQISRAGKEYRIVRFNADTDIWREDIGYVRFVPIPISAADLPPHIWARVNTNLGTLKSLRPLPRDGLQRLRDQLRLYHTYNSNAIEGNTLTLNETRLVLERGVTIGGKSLREHLEATNNARAFDWIWDAARPGVRFDHDLLQRLHEMVTNGILESAGRYRTQQVWIGGSSHVPPAAEEIVPLLDDLFGALTRSREPFLRSVFLHSKIAYVHPFFDGNGRTARLAGNLVLLAAGYPPVVIRVQDRRRYYASLEEADRGRYAPFAGFVLRALDEALVLFLSAVSRERALVPLRELSRRTPYSQEYLSLRARQGILEAVKVDGVWFSSRHALADYMKSLKQGRR